MAAIMSADAVPLSLATAPRLGSPGDFRLACRAAGARPCHEDRLLRLWLTGQSLQTPGTRPEHLLPASLQRALPGLEIALAQLAVPVSEHPAEDEALRWLMQLHDGQTIETVLLPREGLCVSSQIGCAVACRFCMTGRSGLIRQLGSLEILAQVARARQRRPVRKVVFMGMGEPAHNLEAVMEAITLLASHGGIAHKQLVFSTVGDLRVFERLASGPVRPALALSLHSAEAAMRAHLLPKAPRIAPDELVDRAAGYAEASGYPLQVQWTLLEGINDRDEDVDALVRLLKGRHAVLNLIPFNEVADSGYRRPGVSRMVEMARQLHRRGILTKLRRSSGQDVEAGCGQLRARQLAPQWEAAASAAPAGFSGVVTGPLPLKRSRAR